MDLDDDFQDPSSPKARKALAIIVTGGIRQHVLSQGRTLGQLQAELRTKIAQGCTLAGGDTHAELVEDQAVVNRRCAILHGSSVCTAGVRGLTATQPTYDVVHRLSTWSDILDVSSITIAVLDPDEEVRGSGRAGARAIPVSSCVHCRVRVSRTRGPGDPPGEEHDLLPFCVRRSAARALRRVRPSSRPEWTLLTTWASSPPGPARQVRL